MGAPPGGGNEEVEHRRENPGRSAIPAVLLLAVFYTFTTVGGGDGDAGDVKHASVQCDLITGRARLALAAAVLDLPQIPGGPQASLRQQAAWMQGLWAQIASAGLADIIHRAGGIPVSNTSVTYAAQLHASTDAGEVTALYAQAGLSLSSRSSPCTKPATPKQSWKTSRRTPARSLDQNSWRGVAVSSFSVSDMIR